MKTEIILRMITEIKVKLFLKNEIIYLKLLSSLNEKENYVSSPCVLSKLTDNYARYLQIYDPVMCT